MTQLWAFAGIGASIYCIARGIVDIRSRKYIWGVLGLVSAGFILLTPIQTHAVKFDLPMPQGR